jgi:membrane-bound ClpP family serine protease
MLNRFNIFVLLLLAGCQTQGGFRLPFDLPATKPAEVDSVLLHSLSPLRWAGGLCIISGAALLFVSQASKGWIPLGIGVALVVVNALLAGILQNQAAVWLIFGTVIVALLTLGLDLKEITQWLKQTFSRQFLSLSSPSSQERGLDEQS